MKVVFAEWSVGLDRLLLHHEAHEDRDELSIRSKKTGRRDRFLCGVESDSLLESATYQAAE